MLIKRWLFLKLSILLVLGFVTTSLTSYYVSRGYLRNKIITNDLPLTSDNIYSEIQRDLLSPVFISSMMANDTFLRDWILNGEKDVRQIAQYLGEIKNKYNTVSSFFISEKTRNYYYADGVLKTVKADEPRDEWFFRVRQMKKDYEINVDLDMANKDAMTIFINHKVLDFKGNFIGVAGVGLKISAVNALIENYHRKYDRTIYFVSPSGKIVLHSQAQDMHPENIKDVPELAVITNEILSGKSNKLEYTKDGRNIYLNTRYIPELNWILLVEQSDEVGVRNIFGTLVFNLLLCGLITICVLLIIRTAINTYQQKLEKMVKADMELQQINQGQKLKLDNQYLELLDKNAKLTLLNSSKNKLFSIIAHDLRTPIGNISQLLDMLEETFAAGYKAKTAEILLKLKSSADSTFKLLENLFDWARNQISEVTYNQEELNLRQLLRDCLAAHQMPAKEKNIRILSNCDDSLKVIADAHMVKTIIRNLISNAIKFTPENGEIRINAERADDKKISISIHDSGVGIEKERLPLLFDFTQNKTTYGTNGEKGTGLGLSLCRDLVNMNKGELKVESEVGKGSTFSFTLPS
jgi:signal transduction histidine kinase